MFTQHLRSSAVKHVCFWHTCDRLPQNCFLYCDEYHFWAICKSFGVAQSFRQQFDLRTGERNTQKPLRNAMFVFNPFFSHCSHCLTSIERARSGLYPPLPTWLSGSFQRGIPERLLAPATSFLWRRFSFRIAFLLCVRFALFCACFSVFCFFLCCA